MLRAAFAFLLLAIIAGVFGFSGSPGTSSSIGQFFILFLVLFAIVLFSGRVLASRHPKNP
jgi:uncharacterized membrane protein YtjA (UPF0391 family)